MNKVSVFVFGQGVPSATGFDAKALVEVTTFYVQSRVRVLSDIAVTV